MGNFVDFLTLILTLKCREDCFFCHIEKQDLSLSYESARKCVDAFLECGGGYKTVKFFGGDPLLEFGLLKKIVLYGEKKALQLGKRIEFILPTPGTALTGQALDFIRLHNIELVLNSIHLKKLSNDVRVKALRLPLTTLTVNIYPDSADSLSADIKRLADDGFSRFNLLPAYYVRWPQSSLNKLKKELEKIKAFYLRQGRLYLKNFALEGNVPLFNTCPTCDVSGKMYSSNAILFKDLTGHKEELLMGTLDNEQSTMHGERILNIVRKAYPKEILSDTFKADKALSRFLVSLKRPVKMADIKVGNSCNNNCKFCVRHRKNISVRDKNTARVIRNLLDAKRECQGVVFTGGECSIRKDIFELIAFARRLGYEKIQIQTNGRMFSYMELCRRAIEAGATEFEIAIHGHIAQLHDYLTSGEGSFYQTVQAIKNLRELGMPVFTNTVITKPNYRHLAQIAQLLVELGVSQFQFAFVHPMGQAKDNFDSVVPRMSMVAPFAKKGLDIGLDAGLQVMTEAIPFCLLGKYKDYAAENIIPSTQIYDLSGEAMDFDKVRLKLAKAKGPQCGKCRFFKCCEGVWCEYPEKFGWGEFSPVR
jgi:MoaA/NifB/PqqE/SkfB family radical SAM enzyme